MQASGESHCLLSCSESFPAPSPLPYIVCYVMFTHHLRATALPATGNLINLINNHSHFYFCIKLDINFFTPKLRHNRQNFIIGKMNSGILQELEQYFVLYSNKTKYNTLGTPYTVCRKLKWSSVTITTH